MKHLFKAAAGVMSAFVLAAGAGTGTQCRQSCPQSALDACSQQNVCISDTQCTGDELQKLISECRSTNELLQALKDNGLCSKDDLSCLGDSACTVDDVCDALANCGTEQCDIVSVIEKVCEEQGTCTDSAPQCDGEECEKEQTAAIHDKQGVSEDTKEAEVTDGCDAQSCEDNACAPACEDEKCENESCVDDSCEAPIENDCSGGECQPQTIEDTVKDSGTGTRLTFGNINDLLKAFGIELRTDTQCGADGCKDSAPQKNDTDTEKAADSTENGEAETEYAVSEYEAEVVRLVNEIRADYGLSELTLNEELSAVARLKSEDMRDKHYFSHNSPTYGSPFDMMKRFGISYRTAGENIAMGQRTPQEVVNGWMNSEGHRANILNASFTQIGVGYADGGNYWTQMFIG